MRLINADELNKVFDMVCSNEVLRKQIGQYIDSAPTVDAVEVIRCRDCKHYSRLCSCLLHSEIADIYSSGFAVMMDGNDFCSYGEKK